MSIPTSGTCYIREVPLMPQSTGSKVEREIIQVTHDHAVKQLGSRSEHSWTDPSSPSLKAHHPIQPRATTKKHVSWAPHLEEHRTPVPKCLIWADRLEQHHPKAPQGMIWPESLARHHATDTQQAMIAPVEPRPRKQWAKAQPTEYPVILDKLRQQLGRHALSAATDLPSQPLTRQACNPAGDAQRLNTLVNNLHKMIQTNRPQLEQLQRSEASLAKHNQSGKTLKLSTSTLNPPCTRQPGVRQSLSSRHHTATPVSRTLPPLAQALAQSAAKDTPKDKALDTLLGGLMQFTRGITRQYGERGEGKYVKLIDAQIKAQLSGLSIGQTQRVLASLTGGLGSSIRAISRFASTQPASGDSDVQSRDAEQFSRLSRAGTVVGRLVRELNRKLDISTAGMRASEATTNEKSRLSRLEQDALVRVLTAPQVPAN